MVLFPARAAYGMWCRRSHFRGTRAEQGGVGVADLQGNVGLGCM